MIAAGVSFLLSGIGAVTRMLSLTKLYAGRLKNDLDGTRTMNQI